MFWKSKKKWESKLAENEYYGIIHIPKTAGTTFRNILYNHFDNTQIYPTPKDLQENGGRYLRQEEIVNQVDIKQKAIILGHYGYFFINQLLPNSKLISFVRNPVDRIISHITHVINDPKKEYTDPNKVLEEHYKILDLQSRILGYSVRAKSYDRVMRNIDNMAFIGITEEFDTSIQLINKIFGWKLENITPLNQKKSDISDLIHPSTIEQIINNSETDRFVYNYCLEKFNSLKSEYGTADTSKDENI